MVIDAFVIPSDRDLEPAFVWQSDGATQYEFIRGCVRGFIEPIALPKDMWMYVNEEGKVLGLPINRRANRLMRRVHPFFALMDIVVGNAVICGRIDEYGSHLRLSPEQRNILTASLTAVVTTRRTK